MRLGKLGGLATIVWITLNSIRASNRPPTFILLPKYPPPGPSKIRIAENGKITPRPHPLQLSRQPPPLSIDYDDNPHRQSQASGSVMSSIKDMIFGASHPEENEEEPEATGKGWGWKKDKHYHKHVYNIKKSESGSSFSGLDALLGALAVASLGAFLLPILAALFSVLGLFQFTTTTTYPATVTTPGSPPTDTGTVTDTATFLSTAPLRYFRAALGKKKRKKNGKVFAKGGIGGTKGDPGEYDFTDAGTASAAADSTEDESNDSSSYYDVEERSNKKSRKTRSIWVPIIHPLTSLDVAARSVLDSIESMQSKYQCMERIVCDSNQYAQIVGQGLQIFMPMYSFTSCYFGQKLGLHKRLPHQVRAIILGLQEANCQSNFPQCDARDRL